MMYVSPERLYVNRDKSKIVAEDSGEAAWLLVPKGGELDMDVARFYGLVGGEKAPEEPVEEVAASGIQIKSLKNKSTKHVSAPEENKQVEPESDKQE